MLYSADDIRHAIARHHTPKTKLRSMKNRSKISSMCGFPLSNIWHVFSSKKHLINIKKPLYYKISQLVIFEAG